MCGIAGYINVKVNNVIVDPAAVLQEHRGPDAQKSWSRDNILLSHQRLSIIDPEARSDQPFEKNGLVLVYNGEIYNYRELKASILEALPDTEFVTNSDTEVLLEMFRWKGTDCLADLVGMFAFAILDTNTNRLTLARDHFGIKPLFYTYAQNGFAFASELKTLTELPGFDSTINRKSLVAAVNYLWVPGNETMFLSCRKLPPAHFLELDIRDTSSISSPVCYWELPTDLQHKSEDEWTTEIRNALESSVTRHMIADVPVSSFLSGGLDSSLLSVIAGSQHPGLSTYTIGTTEEQKKVEQMPADEKYAREVAEKHGFDHHEILLHADIVKRLPQMIYQLDEPIGDPAALNTYLICKAAHERGVKVLLSGMGADEIFFGYRRQKATLLSLRFKKLPGFLRSFIGWTAGKLPVRAGKKGLRLVRWGKRFLDFASLPLEEAYMRSYSYYDETSLNELFAEPVHEEYAELRKQHRSIFEKAYPDDPVNQICFTDIQMFMNGLNLTYTDRASMAASVEVRVPFIDKRFVELAMQIPGDQKFRNNESKYLLKKAAEKYLDPAIIYRPKASFGAPIRAWISKDLVPMIDNILSEESIRNRGWFNPKMVRRMIEDDRLGREDNAYRIYELLTIELWCRRFLDRKSGVED